MPVVDICLKNSSSNSLDWVKLEWHAGRQISAGILAPGIWKANLAEEWPNESTATISFVDAKTRTPYSLEVSLSAVNDQMRTGQCHQVTVRIWDYDRADAICE